MTAPKKAGLPPGAGVARLKERLAELKRERKPAAGE
jgi:hypothetical protein